jgi:hypothetical protein
MSSGARACARYGKIRALVTTYDDSAAESRIIAVGKNAVCKDKFEGCKELDFEWEV